MSLRDVGHSGVRWDMGCCGITRDMGRSGVPQGHGTLVWTGIWDTVVFLGDVGYSGVPRSTGHSSVFGDRAHSQCHLPLVPLYSRSCRERRLRFAGWGHWTSGDREDKGQDPTVVTAPDPMVTFP